MATGPHLIGVHVEADPLNLRQATTTAAAQGPHSLGRLNGFLHHGFCDRPTGQINTTHNSTHRGGSPLSTSDTLLESLLTCSDSSAGCTFVNTQKQWTVVYLVVTCDMRAHHTIHHALAASTEVAQG